MDSDTIKMYLANVEEFVVDDEKLVSYLWLSKELSIHVNDSKLIIHKFYEEYKKKHPDRYLAVTYIVAGSKPDGSLVTKIALEEELEKSTQDLKVIFYKHIYSIQKAPASLNDVAMVNINPISDFTLYIGKISNDSCVKRPAESLSCLRSKSYSVADIKPKENLLSMHLKPKSEPLKSPNSKNVSPKKTVSPKKDISPKGDKGKKNGIASMFAAQATRANSETSKPQPPAKQKSKNIGNFFSSVPNEPRKCNSKNKDGIENLKKSDLSVEETNVKIEKSASPVKGKQKKEAITTIKTEKETLVACDKKETPKNKKKPAKKPKLEKNRKRVLQLSDSEEDLTLADRFSDDDMEVKLESDDDEVIPPTPVLNPTVNVTSAVINPKKRRKIVDKTYTDDEGYILTKKVEVYESCSEDESEKKENVVEENNIVEKTISETKLEPVKPKGGKGKKKMSPPTKGKQATLTNFFSRKT